MYRTYDYCCEDCGWHTVELFTKGEQPPSIACNECLGSAVYMFVAPNVMNVALPDGTKRFGDLKAMHSLKKAAAQAKVKGERETEKLIRSEIKARKEKQK